MRLMGLGLFRLGGRGRFWRFRMESLYFITGAEGVGKSSIIEILRIRFPNIDVHDFDEVGVPDNPDLQWRYDTTLHWIKVAIENQKKGVSTIIAGLSFPNEVLMYKDYEEMGKVLFCLLDVHESERARRLCKRNASKNVIEDLCQLHQLREKFKEIKFENVIIDTTGISIKDVEEKVVEWIEKDRIGKIRD